MYFEFEFGRNGQPPQAWRDYEALGKGIQGSVASDGALMIVLDQPDGSRLRKEFMPTSSLDVLKRKVLEGVVEGITKWIQDDGILKLMNGVEPDSQAYADKLLAILGETAWLIADQMETGASAPLTPDQIVQRVVKRL